MSCSEYDTEVDPPASPRQGGPVEATVARPSLDSRTDMHGRPDYLLPFAGSRKGRDLLEMLSRLVSPFVVGFRCDMTGKADEDAPEDWGSCCSG